MQRGEFALPEPRAAAVAVMGMLAFGLTIGSLVGGTSVETLASAPLIVVGLAHTTPASQVVQSAPGSQDAGSAGAAPAAATPAATAQQPAQVAAAPSTSPTPADTGTTPAGSSGLPPVKHVFLIVLSDRGFAHSFGAGAPSGYLGSGLRRQGELVQNYYGVAGAPLANEIALVSGQGPTAQTATDCPSFSRIAPGEEGAARSGARDGLRVSLGHEDARQSAHDRRAHLEGLRCRGRRGRPDGLPRAPVRQQASAGGGPLELRRLAQPVPLLPFAAPPAPPVARARSASGSSART